MWRALADITRRRILDLLREGPRTTSDLATLLAKERGLSRFAVMKHLGVLEEAGLLVVKREGRMRWNYVNAAPFTDMYRRWVSRFAALPGEAFFRLKEYVEKKNGMPLKSGGKEEDV